MISNANPLIAIVYALFGLLFGSFANVCILRLPKDESVVKPPSHCPQCGAHIRWRDNIPLISYLALRGRCRDCGAKISIQYPLIEFAGGALFALAYLMLGTGVYSVCAGLFTLILLAVSLTDIQTMMIPDQYPIAIAVLAVVSAFTPSSIVWYDRIIGFVGGGLILYLVAVFSEKVLKKEGMGGGDIKLLAATGAFLGWQLMLLALLLGSFIGSVVGIIAIASKKTEGMAAEVPFAPALAAGMFLSLYFGNSIIGWYIATFVLVQH